LVHNVECPFCGCTTFVSPCFGVRVCVECEFCGRRFVVSPMGRNGIEIDDYER